MKTSLLSLLLMGASLAALPAQTALADDGSTISAGNGTQAERLERFKDVMAALDLTDAQKAQIRQIRATVIDPKERRREILNVLTPEQKAKLRELIEERRSSAGTTSPSNST